ncbi:MAG: lytic transglycosylase domain-containing protein [Bacteroidetes bacterium]|nr:lytic transglycosylase domain-containing protein [Bacteroidota bacterium]MCH7769762.1 lytic transglycosylase domain-containing protein [Bacteroidota bacterium]
MRTINSKSFYFFLGVTLTLVACILSASIFLPNDLLAGSNYNPDEQFPQGYKIISPRIPDYMEFAGERVPLENFDVYERIDREFIVNTYFHSSTILALKRANRWFPVIEPILKKNNIPDDFKFLCVAESNMENVISPAGATGFWQFLKETGQRYGLEINSQIDERYHVEKSTEAACKYLQEAHDLFGSWMMAAGSYNMGIDGMQKQIERQKSNQYYNMVLSAETSRYVSRIMAFKEIFKVPEQYGFDITADEMYAPLKYHTEVLDSSVSDFADHAASLGINYRTLKLYNPWLRDNKLNNKKKKVYEIKIPKEGSIEIIN